MTAAGGGPVAPTWEDLTRAYQGKRVLVTGHTGFKGSWLTLWLHELGAQVWGFSLPTSPVSQTAQASTVSQTAPDSLASLASGPTLFHDARIDQVCQHVAGNVRDGDAMRRVVAEVQPDIVLHLAAQPLVRLSYEQPVATFETNVMGTVHLLEAVRTATARQARQPCAVVVVSSDKCYENREWVYGYREHDPLGGHDPYSASKAGCEIVAASYRRSFFSPERLSEHGVALATARAGNVIGGGDWAADRIVPDCIRALHDGRAIQVRNPHAIRPWQHVLEAVGGYLLLGARLTGVSPSGVDPAGATPSGVGSSGIAPVDASLSARGQAGQAPATFCDAWNLGPNPDDTRAVRDLVELLVHEWGEGSWQDVSDPNARHEATLLQLSTDKARAILGWTPRWNFATAIATTARWYRAWHEGQRGAALRALTVAQIREYAGAPPA